MHDMYSKAVLIGLKYDPKQDTFKLDSFDHRIFVGFL